MKSAVKGEPSEVVVVCCRRALQAGAVGQAETISAGKVTVRPMVLPCSSKVEVPHLLRILESGADGVEVVACPDGDCQFLVGNVRAQRRVEYARRLLEAIGMGAERLGVTRAERVSRERLLSLAEARAERAGEIGPNPMKEERNR